MSGVKYSEIKLEQEKKACQEALSKINALRSGIEGRKENVRSVLGQIPDGVKDSFLSEIKIVKNWLMKDSLSPSEGMNSTELNNLIKQFQKIMEEGEKVIHNLVEIKEVRREAKARECIGKLETLKSDLTGLETSLNRWRPERYRNIIYGLNNLSLMIDRGDFIEVERGLNDVSDTLKNLEQEVTMLDTQERNRLYVLGALRNVCKEMGWAEEREPELEDKDNPASTVLYEVNTYSAGKIAFRLTLDGINVSSQISESKCYRQFDDLSEKLKKFSIITKFEHVKTAGEKPILKQAGELDQPDDGIEIEREM